MEDIIKALEDYRQKQKLTVPGEPAIAVPVGDIAAIIRPGCESLLVIPLQKLIEALQKQMQS